MLYFAQAIHVYIINKAFLKQCRTCKINLIVNHVDLKKPVDQDLHCFPFSMCALQILRINQIMKCRINNFLLSAKVNINFQPGLHGEHSGSVVDCST